MPVILQRLAALSVAAIFSFIVSETALAQKKYDAGATDT